MAHVQQQLHYAQLAQRALKARYSASTIDHVGILWSSALSSIRVPTLPIKYVVGMECAGKTRRTVLRLSHVVSGVSNAQTACVQLRLLHVLQQTHVRLTPYAALMDRAVPVLCCAQTAQVVPMAS